MCVCVCGSRIKNLLKSVVVVVVAVFAWLVNWSWAEAGGHIKTGNKTKQNDKTTNRQALSGVFALLLFDSAVSFSLSFSHFFTKMAAWFGVFVLWSKNKTTAEEKDGIGKLEKGRKQCTNTDRKLK